MDIWIVYSLPNRLHMRFSMKFFVRILKSRQVSTLTWLVFFFSPCGIFIFIFIVIFACKIWNDLLLMLDSFVSIDSIIVEIAFLVRCSLCSILTDSWYSIPLSSRNRLISSMMTACIACLESHRDDARSMYVEFLSIRIWIPVLVTSLVYILSVLIFAIVSPSKTKRKKKEIPSLTSFSNRFQQENCYIFFPGSFEFNHGFCRYAVSFLKYAWIR